MDEQNVYQNLSIAAAEELIRDKMYSDSGNSC